MKISKEIVDELLKECKTEPVKYSAVSDLLINISDRIQFEKVCEQIAKLSDTLSVRRVLQSET